MRNRNLLTISTAAFIMLFAGVTTFMRLESYYCTLSPPMVVDWSNLAPPPPPDEPIGDPGNYLQRTRLIRLLSFRERKAYIRVANAVLFAPSGVGFTIPETVYAWVILFDSPHRLEIFMEIAGIGSPAGKAYALCALYSLSPNDFREILDNVSNYEKRSFRTASGCIVYWVTLEDIRSDFLLGRDSSALIGFYNHMKASNQALQRTRTASAPVSWTFPSSSI